VPSCQAPWLPWAPYTVNQKEWFESLGGPTTEQKVSEAGGENPNYIPGGKTSFGLRGITLYNTLQRNIEERGIPILWETPAKRLLYSGDPYLGNGEVRGVVGEKGGQDVYVKARKAVVLTCGGFEMNEQMLSEYTYGDPCRFYAAVGNTGDGITMAMAVGARLWDMALIGGRPVTWFPPGSFSNVSYGMGYSAAQWNPYVHVSKYGKRFVKMPWLNHTAWTSQMWYSQDVCDFPQLPCWVIFDQSSVDARGPLVPTERFARMGVDYEWSADSSVEVAKRWILKADTLEQLAAEINKEPFQIDALGNTKMDPAVLVDTITRYNQYCVDGVDPELGSDPSTLLAINHPPFYAMKQFPGGVCTFGGPRRNKDGQIVNIHDNPIPRLFSAGELGSLMGFVYEGGWNITELLASGKLVGTKAAALQRWE
jgi:3-oxosteroid 1-dehydrogenase